MIPRPACHVGPGDLRAVASLHMQAHRQDNHSISMQRFEHPQTVGITPSHPARPPHVSRHSNPVMRVHCDAWHTVPSNGSSSCSSLPWKGEKPLSLAELRQRVPRKSSEGHFMVNCSEAIDMQKHLSCGSGIRREQSQEPNHPAALRSVVPHAPLEERAVQRPTHASVETLWRYDGGAGVAIGIRSVPKVDGPWTGKTLLPGDIFCVSQELQGADGIRYLRLNDGSGWVFDRKPGEGTLCVRHGTSFAQDNSEMPEAAMQQGTEVRSFPVTGVDPNHVIEELPTARSGILSRTPLEDCDSETRHLQPPQQEGDVSPVKTAASEMQDVAPRIVHEDGVCAERLQAEGVLPAAPAQDIHAELVDDSVTLLAMPKQTTGTAPSHTFSASTATISTPAVYQQPQALLTSEVGPKTCMPAKYTVGKIIEVLRSDGSYSSGEIKAVHLTGQGICYDVRVDGGGVKLGVPDAILRSFPVEATANVGGSSPVQPAHGENSNALLGLTVIAAAAACPAEAANCAQQSVLNTTARPAVLGPFAEMPVAHSISAALPGEPYRCLRVYLGTLEFHSCGAGLGLSGLFESSGYRARVHLGEQKQQGWNNQGAVTEKQPLKYSRVVSKDGKYTNRISCEFDEAFDLPWAMEHEKTAHVSVDVWLEKRTVVERLDSLLDTVGLGNDMPSFDRTWVGFTTASLPPQGQDTIPQPWPVKKATMCEGPAPKHLSLGVEWLTEAPDLDDDIPC